MAEVEIVRRRADGTLVPWEVDSDGASLARDPDRYGFGESIVAERTSVFHLSSVYPLSMLRNTWQGAVVQTADSSEYEVSAGAWLESAELGRYVPRRILEAGVGVRAVAGAAGTFGYYDPTDGFLWQLADGALSAVVRRGGVDDVIPQAQFNVDPLDGTGPSGLNIDATDGWIFGVAFAWYGHGAIEWNVTDAADTHRQRVVTVHRERRAGQTSIRNPNLPVRVDCSTGVLYVAGRQVDVVGRYAANVRLTAAQRIAASVSTTLTPLCSFRRKDDDASLPIGLRAHSMDVVADADVEVVMMLGATLTGPAWGVPLYRSAAETAIEVDAAASALSGGESLWTDLVAVGGSSQGNSIRRGGDAAELDVRIPRLLPVTLAARALSGTATVSALLRAGEEW